MTSITNIDLRQSNVDLGNNKLSNVNNDQATNNDITEGINPNASAKGWAEDTVSISDEANEQLKEEMKESVSVSGGSESKSIFEMAEELKQKMIDDLKERIEKVSEELQKLKSQDDEGSKEQAKLLQKQINDLNGQLLTIMTSL
jgi:transposase